MWEKARPDGLVVILQAILGVERAVWAAARGVHNIAGTADGRSAHGQRWDTTGR